MSILDVAKTLAEAAQKRDEHEAAQKLKESLARKEVLEQMKKALLAELCLLNGKSCSHGEFRLELYGKLGETGIYSELAYLWCKDSHAIEYKVAWFKARIVSGTVDYSDDVRNVPYTEPTVWARFYPPNPDRRQYDGTWDIEESRWYHNGGWTIAANSVERLQTNFFEEMTKQLARWMV